METPGRADDGHAIFTTPRKRDVAAPDMTSFAHASVFGRQGVSCFGIEDWLRANQWLARRLWHRANLGSHRKISRYERHSSGSENVAKIRCGPCRGVQLRASIQGDEFASRRILGLL